MGISLILIYFTCKLKINKNQTNTEVFPTAQSNHSYPWEKENALGKEGSSL